MSIGVNDNKYPPKSIQSYGDESLFVSVIIHNGNCPLITEN